MKDDLLIVSDRDLAQLTGLRPHEQLQRELDRAIVVARQIAIDEMAEKLDCGLPHHVWPQAPRDTCRRHQAV